MGDFSRKSNFVKRSKNVLDILTTSMVLGFQQITLARMIDCGSDVTGKSDGCFRVLPDWRILCVRRAYSGITDQLIARLATIAKNCEAAIRNSGNGKLNC
jgi:hypothetical protein